MREAGVLSVAGGRGGGSSGGVGEGAGAGATILSTLRRGGGSRHRLRTRVSAWREHGMAVVAVNAGLPESVVGIFADIICADSA